MQADQKPLSVVIIGVIACQVSARAAGSPQDGPHSPKQQHSPSVLLSASGSSSAEQSGEQARPPKKRQSSIDSASAAQAAAERLDGHTVTMQTSGIDEDRDAAVLRKHKREPNHAMEGQETLRQGSEQSRSIRAWELVLQMVLQPMAITPETVRRAAHSTSLAPFPGQQVIRPTCFLWCSCVLPMYKRLSD